VNYPHLLNTFWGLESGCYIQPNVTLTGPLTKLDQNLDKKLKLANPELYAWLEESL
jgi:hypothetical protein